MKTNNVVAIIANTLLCLFLVLGFLCFFSAAWYVRVYGRIGFESILYTLTASLGGVEKNLVRSYLIEGFFPALLCSGLSALLLLRKSPLFGKIPMFSMPSWLRPALCIVVSFVLILHAAFNVELVNYIHMRLSPPSSLYESEYQDPRQANITFPEQKRNLIYIMLESMETSYMSAEDGGALPYNLIPELTSLAENNINFSHNNSVGGFSSVWGVGWTIASMVAQTSGVPLVTPVGEENSFGANGSFLPGLTNLHNILQDNGYSQALMVGSDAEFGGRKTYYTTHGIDKIYDLYTARADGIVPEGYYAGWGIEDKYLFSYAKQKILQMAEGSAPFAFTMLTVDTHHIGGYICEDCQDTYEEQYENVISCSSKQVGAFISWLQQQDFYENTTIVIVGDHCSMDNGYFSRNVDEGYTRHIYNCFINAAATPTQTKNRQYNAMDLFPTTLAAMGCWIPGDRLGLGTNLFSTLPTLLEEMGYATFNSELSKDSLYYTNNFY